MDILQTIVICIFSFTFAFSAPAPETLCGFPPTELVTTLEYTKTCSNLSAPSALKTICETIKNESDCYFMNENEKAFPLTQFTTFIFDSESDDRNLTLKNNCQYMVDKNLLSFEGDTCEKICGGDAILVCDLFVAMDKTLRYYFEQEVKKDGSGYKRLDVFIHPGTYKSMFPFPSKGALHSKLELEACMNPNATNETVSVCTMIGAIAVEFANSGKNFDVNPTHLVKIIGGSWDPCENISTSVTFPPGVQVLQDNSTCAVMCGGPNVYICKIIVIGLQSLAKQPVTKPNPPTATTKIEGDNLKEPNSDIKDNSNKKPESQAPTPEKPDSEGEKIDNNTNIGGESVTDSTKTVKPVNEPNDPAKTTPSPLSPVKESNEEHEEKSKENEQKEDETENIKVDDKGAAEEEKTSPVDAVDNDKKNPLTEPKEVVTPAKPVGGEKSEGVDDTSKVINNTEDKVDSKDNKDNVAPVDDQKSNDEGETSSSTFVYLSSTTPRPKGSLKEEEEERYNIPSDNKDDENLDESLDENLDESLDENLDENQYHNQKDSDFAIDKPLNTFDEAPQHNSKSSYIPQESYEEVEEEASGHFMAYFLVLIVVCVAGYIIFHNKSKIIALVIEGKGPNSGRRPSSKEYKRLKTEDVMPSLEKSAYSKNYVF